MCMALKNIRDHYDLHIHNVQCFDEESKGENDRHKLKKCADLNCDNIDHLETLLTKVTTNVMTMTTTGGN
jgi:hypothetical protein